MTRHEVDPELRPALEEMLATYPRGIYVLPDVGERRRIEAELTPPADFGDSVVREDHDAVARDGAMLPVRVYRPTVPAAPGPLPGVFFVHGGGMVSGSLDFEEAAAVDLARALGAVVVSTSYRKAPEHAHPVQSLDCYDALLWLEAHAATLSVDPGRLALYGGSAGGNLVLAVALRVRDHGGPPLRLIVAAYPMVDHRNVLPSTYEVVDLGVWDRATNVEAWGWFLGGAEPDGYAAPLHADSLEGLPPVFLDIGSVDLFRDETIALVQRLYQASVPTEFHLYPGAYHAAEFFAPESAYARRVWSARYAALRRALDE